MLHTTQIHEETVVLKYMTLKDIFFMMKLHIISRGVKTHGWQ